MALTSMLQSTDSVLLRHAPLCEKVCAPFVKYLCSSRALVIVVAGVDPVAAGSTSTTVEACRRLMIFGLHTVNYIYIHENLPV